MAKRKKKLSDNELNDIKNLMDERVLNAVLDATQLVDDPQQRAQMVTYFASVVFSAAVMVVRQTLKDMGKKTSKKQLIELMAVSCAKEAMEI